ncbi:MAG: radical SAM protein [Syntrophaceae bacterium]|nr:radical SAM protein [Syntrophaceae bacterium]
MGFSLGVDIVPTKTCTLDCIYCQVGRTSYKTVERKEYIAPEKVLAEFREVLKSGKKIDYITLSGNGEPTLNLKIGEIIKSIKNISPLPVAVITNGTLLSRDDVRKDLLSADLVMPSLDVAIQETFEKIDRPHPSLKIDKIIEGLVEFRKIYKGKFWLEIMLVKGINDTQIELNALKKAIEKINPDKIQLNTPVRPTYEKDVEVLSADKLKEIKEFFGEKCEILVQLDKRKHEDHVKIISILRDKQKEG